MTTRIATWMAALTVIVVLVIPGRVTAQQHRDAEYPYILIDLGTLGGPNSCVQGPSASTLNNQGVVIGLADTPSLDTDAHPSLPDCRESPYISHAFRWQRGVLTDLGALPGGKDSDVESISESGIVVGGSENGIIDPLTGSPEVRAIVWTQGRRIELGTFGGNESGALVVNNQGQVAGVAANTIPDPFSMLGFGTQTRGFIWQDGHMRDLGTLGGNDTFPLGINDRGQVVGQSFTNAAANTATGMPTMDPFLWQDGQMIDLGSLGGTVGTAGRVNERGEIIGQSDLAGDRSFHPFLWKSGTMIDLGTLGGNFGSTNLINEAGHIVGWATLPGDSTAHAVLWRNGTMLDLGTVPGQPCSYATSLNARDQVVGGSCTSGGNGWLWEHGTLSDLNALVAPSPLHLTEARVINERGEIGGLGELLDGRTHGVLLVPSALAVSEGLTSNAPAPGTIGPATGVRSARATCMWGPGWLHRPAPTFRPRPC